VVRKPSITAFLFFMIAAVAICGFLVFGTSLILFARSDGLRADDEAERLSVIIGSSIKAVLSEPESIMELAGAMIDSDPSHVDMILQTIRRDSRYFRSVMWLDQNGIVRSVAPPSSLYAGADYSSAPFMADIRSAVTVRWSSIYAGLDEGTREISMRLDAGTGVVMGILDFDALAARLAVLLGNSAAGLSLADSGGTYIVHKDRTRVDRRESDHELLEQRLNDPVAAVYRFTRGDARNAPRVIARRVPETGWFAIVERPADFAMDTFLESVPFVSVMAALAISFAAGLATIATRRLVLDVKAAGREAENSGGTDAAETLYFRETAAILTAARAAAGRMRAKEEDNARLEALNARLEKALSDLAAAQAALIESEREAVTGMMATAMAHELNTPIAAADSAAGEAERAALDVLAYARRNPDLKPLAQSAAAVIVGLAEAYDPDYALNGLDRRKSSKIAEACLAKALRVAGLEPVEELDAFILAGQLVDLGVTASDSADMETIAGALGVCTDMTLSLLAAAEIVVSSRVIKSGMAKAHAVVSTIKGCTASESPGGRRPVRVGASVEDAIALLYTRTKKGVELKVSLMDDPWIDAEPGLLQRVWMSMIGNALDAIDYHGYIGIRISTLNGIATIDFEDSGPAVPEEMLLSVWNPEYAQNFRDIRGGMNLASIRRLIDMTGGQASCSVVSGHTIFSIRFCARDGEGASGVAHGF